jgi:hypothetical protein
VELLFLCLLFGAGRFFIILLDVCALFVDGSFSPISGGLVLAVCDVSGCRACIGSLVPGCLFFVLRFSLAPRTAG